MFQIPLAHWINVNLPASCPPRLLQASPLPSPHKNLFSPSSCSPFFLPLIFSLFQTIIYLFTVLQSYFSFSLLSPSILTFLLFFHFSCSTCSPPFMLTSFFLSCPPPPFRFFSLSYFSHFPEFLISFHLHFQSLSSLTVPFTPTSLPFTLLIPLSSFF